MKHSVASDRIIPQSKLFSPFSIGYGGYVGAMVTTYDISRHLVPRKLNLKDGSNTIEGN